MNAYSYAHVNFDKDAQNILWRKDSLFNKCRWENSISECKKLKLDPPVTPCTKVNSMWIKDLNIRYETLKQLQEVLGSTLKNIVIDNDFLNGTPMTQQLRERMN
jgi:hypothetical protein